MIVATADPMPIRVSSSPLTPGAIVRGHEGFMKLNMQLDFANRSSSGRKLSVVARSFGPVGVGRVDGTPSSFYRRPCHLADGRDLISIVISGGGRFQLDGTRGESRFSAHGAAILESRSASALHSLDDSTAWTICMERAPLEPLLAGIAQPLQCCLPGDNPGLRLLEAYLAALFSLQQEWDLALVTRHIRDLALSALGVRGEVQALVRERGVQAARQTAALAAIRARASEPGLDAAHVAMHVGLSVRYLHRLLESTGRTFAEHLLGRRLDCAAAMLRDSGSAHLKIGEIASRAGFSDISHFNRSFRRRFGDTPHGVRVRAVRQANSE
jgi:AraC-like DNA-binding protein